MIGWIIGGLSFLVGLARLLVMFRRPAHSPEQAAADLQAKVDEPLINRPDLEEAERLLDEGKG